MYASIIRLNLGSNLSLLDRGRCGRSLASALDDVPGFIAFVAFESEEGAVTGLCICADAEALAVAERVASAWQRERGEEASSALQTFSVGEVIVQRGF